ncbi:uncharacterized protein LOC116602263 [Nematostella vectensis]|uniref:uncharacterized protein LOC116602263 n=1 Tax=Nematostella vectensis TaxID=45351 RepID=UPI0020779A59|nr:uncharacterized protein LOC116602263 [Nematostella vectensis]
MKLVLLACLLLLLVSSGQAIHCYSCNLTTSEQSCENAKKLTDCDTVKLDGTNKTADSCYIMNGTKSDGSSVYIQHCTLRAGCSHICNYFNQTHLSNTLRSCDTKCFNGTVSTPSASATTPTATTKSSSTVIFVTFVPIFAMAITMLVFL